MNDDVVKLAEQNVAAVEDETRRGLKVHRASHQLLHRFTQRVEIWRRARVVVAQWFCVECRNVVGIGVPKLHHLAANERDVEAAGVLALRVEGSTAFVTSVRDNAAAQHDAGAFRKSLLEFAVEGDKETFISAKRERQDTRADLVFAHFMSIFW